MQSPEQEETGRREIVDPLLSLEVRIGFQKVLLVLDGCHGRTEMSSLYEVNICQVHDNVLEVAHTCVERKEIAMRCLKVIIVKV
jgi:hypothetical protein